MKKPSKQFVSEMERMYPKGAAISPAKKPSKPVKSVKPPKTAKKC